MSCDLKCSRERERESRKSADSTHGKSQSSCRHQDIPENTRSRSINIPADTWPTAERNQAIEPAATYLLNFLEENVQRHQETSVSHQSQPVLTLMCFTEHKWVGNWEEEGENEKERGLRGESFHSLFSLWLSSGELLLPLSPCVLSISVTHNARWLPAFKWIPSPALKHMCCLTTESDEVRNRRGRWQREEWERATVMRLK